MFLEYTLNELRVTEIFVYLLSLDDVLTLRKSSTVYCIFISSDHIGLCVRICRVPFTAC